ncbi:MAG: hypothetical protein GX275_09965 [Clostridiales bacterium]|nr:hypothetical protein [Clostridiales bacterium]
MKFELIEVKNKNNCNIDCYPDFFDDCNPTADDCMPMDLPEGNVSE